MKRIKFAAFCLMTLGTLAAAAQDQQPQEAPAAPVPQQILAAKKIFIVNLGSLDADTARYFKMSPERAYNEFYAAMKSWGRYELVSNPADADLVFEAGFLRPIALDTLGVVVPIEVVILDPKTHIALWTFTENNGLFHSKPFVKALATLVNDVKNLAGRGN